MKPTSYVTQNGLNYKTAKSVYAKHY